MASHKDPKVQRALKRAGVEKLDSPKMTPSHETKKAVVVTMVDGSPKMIRFGDQKMGHNYSPEARASFKARHGEDIKKGKSSAAYWSNKFLWAGSKGNKKNPPKSQKIVKGRKPKR